MQNKIHQLLHAISQDPFSGIGKPEMLKHNLTGLWSRRINQEHRIIYEVLEEEKTIKIHSLRGHY
ncbi:Txe/YoeB family addiction module toxin [Mucilaginibacter gossypiicola]|uniref:Txe/YoeB family addiction module toxin n=1 Tax=Mucilaginibacter gossypiicola TaxID=551995 RepID=UPI001AD7FE31|nr:Txe/YoeB family addiction module toxin [Mucilaginibacter gossypiicola]